MSELAVHQPPSGTLALTSDQTAWTEVQVAALAHIGIADAPPADQQVFMHVCQRTQLDPFNREIYMIKRKERGEDKWTIQTGIDGFRKRAEEHPQYAGTLDPEWCGPDGQWHDAWVSKHPPVAARVRVLRHDRANPISLPVRFEEFAARFSDGNLQGQWKTKPAHMIGKVAEAASLRKAFPKTFAGLYTDDEMDHLNNSRGGRGGGQIIDQGAAPAVTAAELTGQAPPPAKPDPAPEPAAQQQPEQASPAEEKPARRTTARQTRKADPAAEQQGEKRDPKSMSKLFALIGKSDIEDRHDWASGVLGKDVESFATLGPAEVSRLIDRLENPPPDDDEPIDAELVEEEPTAEQLQREAEEDAGSDQ